MGDMDVMKSFSFVFPVDIEFGVGVVSKLPDILRKLEGKKPLLVTDKGIVGFGILGVIEDVLKTAQVGYDIFDDVSPNPRDQNVHDGAAYARSNGNDCLIAIGGGSPIDCAKGIAVMATHGGIIQDYRGVEKIPGKTLPIISIPTTAGTGSEVTFSSVITDLKERTKFSFRSVKVASKVALCDPELTATMPKALTAATGMDALTHAIEGFTANCSEPIANAVALHSIELINKYLRRAVEDGSDIEARAGMLMGSLLGAISFSHSDVAAVHCIAESLGGMYDNRTVCAMPFACRRSWTIARTIASKNMRVSHTPWVFPLQAMKRALVPQWRRCASYRRMLGFPPSPLSVSLKISIVKLPLNLLRT